MSKLTYDWILEQLEEAAELGNTPQNARDFALLSIAKEYMEKCPGRWSRHAENEKKPISEPYANHHGMDAHAETLTPEKVREWVGSMISADPSKPKGGKWTMDDVKPLAIKMGVPTEGERFLDFYIIMNAMYSDYYEVARKYNLQNNPAFFADMAKAWLDDPDAVDDKTAAYYRYIVKH